jgi:flagellar basal body P-ring formation protein FlgA
MKRLLVIATLAAAPALAQTTDLGAIDLAVAGFTGAQIGQPGGAVQPVDRRMRLRTCAVPLGLGWYGARRQTVEVTCPVPGGWRIYVPLRGEASTALAQPMIERGDTVTIIVSSEGFAVSQPGEAMEPGAFGAWIKVRTLGAKAEPMRARVLRPGAVGIELP